jgi:hypothetical protein
MLKRHGLATRSGSISSALKKNEIYAEKKDISEILLRLPHNRGKEKQSTLIVLMHTDI